jgi:CHASE3 domain sensor protein
MKTRSLQDKLFLTFALTTLVAALAIALNLHLVWLTQSMLNQITVGYGQAQVFYQTAALLENLEQAEQSYTLTSEARYLDQFKTTDSQLAALLQQLQAEIASPDEQAVLLTIDQGRLAYRVLFDQVIGARQAEDWTTIDRLDQTASDQMITLTDQLDPLTQARVQQVQQIDARYDLFASLSRLMTGVAILAFAITLVVTVLIVNNQIYRPAARLRKAIAAFQVGPLDPSNLETQANRGDEVGAMTLAFLHTAGAVEQNETGLRQQATDLRAQM